jgi:hypothetical protein
MTWPKRSSAGSATGGRRSNRTGDDTGVVIRVTPVRQEAFQGGSRKGWQVDEHVAAGRKALLGSRGSRSFDYGRSADGYRDLARAIGEALSRPPDEAWESFVSDVQER